MKVLTVIDVQRDFFDPAGSLYVAGGESLPAKIAAVMPQFDKVVFTLDWHPGDHCSFKENGGPWPAHCVAYTQGAGLADEFAPVLAKGPEYVRLFFKGTEKEREEYGAFDGLGSLEQYSAIYDWLRTADEIGVCGIAGDYCVRETAARILDLVPASRVKMLKDLICSIDDGSTLDSFMKENNLL